MAALLRSIHVGRPDYDGWAADVDGTSIRKRPVEGPLRATAYGIEGDRVAHPEVHGGRDQAVYAYAREDLDHWSAELGREIPDGMFGENLTTEGIDVNEALVGERWRIGEALFEVAKVRIPCNTFKGWMGESGFDNTAWVKRFTLANRPGPYLRVLEEGVIRAGDAIDVVRRPDHGLTVSFMFRALTTERQLAPELLRIDGLATSLREWVERHS
jgi:MOSC domain-containing protein YiiM